MRWLIVMVVLGLVGCESMSHQQVSTIDADGNKTDALNRDATDAGIPLCSEVTLKKEIKECRIR